MLQPEQVFVAGCSKYFEKLVERSTIERSLGNVGE